MPRKKEQTEQIRAESRQKILTTARHLFAEKGYDGCNVSDIAKTAGMSQGNIYWYFPSKQDVYAAVLAEGFQALGAVMAEAATGPGSAAEKLEAFLDSFMALMKLEGGDEFMTIVVTLIAQGGVQRLGNFGLSTYEIGAGYHQSLNAIFAQGQAEGIFSSDVDANLLSTFFFSFVNGLMLMYPDEWKDIPEDVFRQAIWRLVGLKDR
jgi:AcrR family transcriptional regulator